MFKKSTALLLALFMIIMTMPTVLSSIAYVTGDINSDNVVNLTDYIMVKRYVLGTGTLTSAQLELADIDNDGDVDDVDYVAIRRLALNITESRVNKYRKTAVSYSKSYTMNVSPGNEYGDYLDTNDSELTDGAFANSAEYSNVAFVGFQHDTVEVIIDLEDEGVNICGFGFSYLVNDPEGVNAPKTAKIYGSDNKSNWYSVSIPSDQAYKYSWTDIDSTHHIFMDLDTEVDYRYIKFSFTRSKHWFFIDELLVYANVEQDISLPTDTQYDTSPLIESTQQTNLSNVASSTAYNPGYGRVLISSGKSVSLNSVSGDPRCTNSTTTITDGAPTGVAYEKLSNWYGFKATSNTSYLRIDLGSSRSDLCGFVLHCFNRPSAKIELPTYVDVSVSTSSSSGYTTIGRVYATNTSQENYAFILNFDSLIKGRYVKFSFPASNGYYWIEEAEVYANKTSSESLYGNFEMPLSEITSYWDKNTEDYNITQNLLLGHYPEILSDSSLTKASMYVNGNTLETSSALTDGILSDNTDRNSDSWFRFYYGSGRSVFFDLGHISALSDVSVNLLRKTSSNVYLPDTIDVILSENGKDWYTAGQIVTDPSINNASAASSVTFDKSYRARYIMFKFAFNNGIYICMDEIIVNGTKNVTNAVALESAGLKAHDVDFGYSYAAPSEDVLGGVEDVCLIYFNAGNVSTDMILPYAAYIDENGNIVDTMYDGFLFLPELMDLPSGGRPYQENTATDWYWLANQVFTKNKNLDALDQTAETIKDLLGKEDFKYKVYLTIPYMLPLLYGEEGDRNGDGMLDGFGDIDGNGVNEDFRVQDDRVFTATYYATYLAERFEAQGYENIELCGFYYFHEECRNWNYIDDDNDSGTPDAYHVLGDEDCTKAVNAAFDELGYQYFWIPYFAEWSFNYKWQSLGFDNACLQPNYAFDIDETDGTRLKEAAEKANKYNMSLEIEIAADAATDRRFAQKYFEYLAGGVKYGYINECIHMFYQSFDNIGIHAYSEKPLTRLIYTYTYQFIKGATDISPDAVEPLSYTTDVNMAFNGNLNVSDSATSLYRTSLSPKHGSLSISENGDFTYYPNKDFKGTDTFTYQIGNYLGWSEECTVTVTVD